MPDRERRHQQESSSRKLEHLLNADQLATLHSLESFGWELKFVRLPLFQDPVPVVFDGSRERFAILKPDGTLDEEPGIDIRHQVFTVQP
jgi:hypothetical protein